MDWELSQLNLDDQTGNQSSGDGATNVQTVIHDEGTHQMTEMMNAPGNV